MTIELFREDGYLKTCSATIAEVRNYAIVVDQTIFYPTGGGQPGDIGVLRDESNQSLNILGTVKDREDGSHLHLMAEGHGLSVGQQVELEIDWSRRHKLMRLHSCMHMLCAVIPAPVTGGSIRDDNTARLDFDLPEPPDKLAIEIELNALTQRDIPMSLSWITDEEMAASPELVRTMSVQPPAGSGKVRLVHFAEVDLQPCGGTHVNNANEIGPILIQSIKKKGKQNRRITIALAE
ncbi:MAG: misacylated tRNA(Ala) deacylase [Saprospiraceae bacterium]|jgi:misacylated tRNA(Ala) deacylase